MVCQPAFQEIYGYLIDYYSFLAALSAAQTVLMITMMSNKGQGFRAPLWVYDNYAHIATSAVIVAFVVSLAVYIGSFIGGPRLLALGGNTGNPIYDASTQEAERDINICILTISAEIVYDWSRAQPTHWRV